MGSGRLSTPIGNLTPLPRQTRNSAMKRFLNSALPVLFVLASFGCGKHESAVVISPRRTPLEAPPPQKHTPVGRLEDDRGSGSRPMARPMASASPTNPGQESTVSTGKPTRMFNTPPVATVRPGPPPVPERPKADETVNGSYEFGGQKVEIDGICSFAESGISCWDMKGEKNADLERRIGEAIEKQEASNSYGVTASIRLGRKNRFVVVRNTRVQTSQQPGGYRGLNVQSVGSSTYDQGHAGIYLESPRHDFSSNTLESYEVKMVAEKPEVRETSVRLNKTEGLNETASMDCKVGAKTEFAGYSLTVTGVSTGAPKTMGYATSDKRPVWTLKLKRTGSPARTANIRVTPVDETGKPTMYVDEQGNPMSVEEFGRQMRDRAEGKKTPGQSPYPHSMGVVGGMMLSQDGTMELVLYVNPKKVKALQIFGSYNQIIDITGIPLDPRK
jgi:hypothetical protein